MASAWASIRHWRRASATGASAWSCAQARTGRWWVTAIRTGPKRHGFPSTRCAHSGRPDSPLTLCTDNPGISRTTLADEYLAAARMAGCLPVWDALAMLKQGFAHAFLPSAERESLMKAADARIYRAVLRRFARERG